ncbi:cytochrome P450, partial [Flammula alnicola]
YSQFRYTLGPRLLDNSFHVDVIRMAMTRNIGARYQDIQEEVVRAYNEAIPSTANGWVSLTAYDLQVDVISRVSSRYFVGKPLCENLEFRRVCERATMEIFKGRFIRIFPTFMRPLGSWLLTDIHGLRAKMEEFLRPLIAHRLEQEKTYGAEWPGKPNDLIAWLMDAARAAGEEIMAADLSSRVLFISFGAIHTSSAAFTAALYQLCLSPQDAQELREEVERVVSHEGWSKAALGKMHKVDSYLRESQRIHFMSVLTMGRTVLKDFTFSDGTIIPKNTSLAVNVSQDIYPDPHVFNDFRFVRKDGEAQPLVATPT